jgi:hypothetical protein
MRPVTILYEDQALEGEVKNYGPHLLVRQLVCDRLHVSPWDLKQFEGVPKKGASKLRSECCSSRPKFGRDGRLVFAVYDADKVREQVKLPSTACKPQVKDVLRGESSLGDNLIVVLLEMNIETVIEAICTCDATIPAELREAAIRRKSLSARDILLKRAASPTAAGRRLRDGVLHAVPSLVYLVSKLVARCA